MFSGINPAQPRGVLRGATAARSPASPRRGDVVRVLNWTAEDTPLTTPYTSKSIRTLRDAEILCYERLHISTNRFLTELEYSGGSYGRTATTSNATEV